VKRLSVSPAGGRRSKQRMPIYEFECLECGAAFEKLVRKADTKAEVARKLEEKRSVFSPFARGGFSGSSGGCAPGGG
jgi:putative FmdB family regulatory protein